MAQASRSADPPSGRGRQGVQLFALAAASVNRGIHTRSNPGHMAQAFPPGLQSTPGTPSPVQPELGHNADFLPGPPLRTQARVCRLLSGIPLGPPEGPGGSSPGACLGARAAGLSCYQPVSSALGPWDREAAAPSRRVNLSRYWPDRSSPAASSSLAPARQPLLPGHTFHPFNHLYCLALDPVPGPHPLRGVLT